MAALPMLPGIPVDVRLSFGNPILTAYEIRPAMAPRLGSAPGLLQTEKTREKDFRGICVYSRTRYALANRAMKKETAIAAVFLAALLISSAAQMGF
jgi:hypothetical protein